MKIDLFQLSSHSLLWSMMVYQYLSTEWGYGIPWADCGSWISPYILIERLMQTNYYLNDILAITFLSYRFSLFLLLLCDSIESRALAFFQLFFVLFLFRHLHNFFSISCTLCALFYSPLLLVAHCLRIVAVNIIIFFACCFSIYCYLEHCSKSIGTIICTRFAVVSAWNPWTT